MGHASIILLYSIPLFGRCHSVRLHACEIMYLQREKERERECKAKSLQKTCYRDLDVVTLCWFISKKRERVD